MMKLLNKWMIFPRVLEISGSIDLKITFWDRTFKKMLFCANDLDPAQEDIFLNAIMM